jgi:4-amino-4-deoxy-L-arabinose transferase-like glycosyltransferase
MKNIIDFLKAHRERFLLAAILGVSFLLRLAFLHEPFERDEGHYAAIAQVILRGGMPYRDAIEIKPPGAFYLYALAIQLFGATTEGIRIFTSIYALLTVITVYAFARRMSGAAAGLSAAATYGVFSTFPLLQGSSSNTEVFLVLPMTAGALFLVMALDSGKRRYLMYCGLCAALAMLIKTVALPVVALEFLFIAFIRSGKERMKDYAVFVLPVIVCAALTCAYFALRGAFDDFYYWNAVFPVRYRSSGISGPPLSKVLIHLAPSLLFPTALALFSLPWFWSYKRSVSGLFTLLLVPAVWCSVALPGKFFPHYFISIVPFLSIPAGIALAHLARLKKPAAFLLLAVAAVILGFSIKENYRFYTEYTPETVSMIKYGPTFVNAASIAQYLKERTLPDDYIFQWGLEPELYFLADRRSPVPYLASVLVGWSQDPEKAQQRLLEGLVANQPKYIVFQNEWSVWPGLEEVQAVIDNHYVLDQSLPSGYIARRRDLPM